jgi:hypothetical protein
MKKIIGKFITKIRQKLFASHVEREIYRKIFPHLRQEADHGYPFKSDEEIVESNMQAFLTAESTLRLIERAASKMPQAEGNAFKHITYRDLQQQMWKHVEFAHERMQSSDCDRRFVATRATA